MFSKKDYCKMLITFEWIVPQRSDAYQNDHKSKVSKILLFSSNPYWHHAYLCYRVCYRICLYYAHLWLQDINLAGFQKFLDCFLEVFSLWSVLIITGVSILHYIGKTIPIKNSYFQWIFWNKITTSFYKKKNYLIL